MKQKFPGLSLAEIETVLKDIGKVYPAAETLEVKSYSHLPHCFVIAAA